MPQTGLRGKQFVLTLQSLFQDYSKHFLGPVNDKNTQSQIEFLKLSLQNLHINFTCI